MDEYYIIIIIIVIAMLILFNRFIYLNFLSIKCQFWISVSILYSLVTLDQTVREMTAALEAMKSVHSSMVFSRDRFTRFHISYIFIVILEKTVRTANHIAGFLACIWFRLQIYIPSSQKSLTLDSGRERFPDQRVVVRRVELNWKRGWDLNWPFSSQWTSECD